MKRLRSFRESLIFIFIIVLGFAFSQNARARGKNYVRVDDLLLKRDQLLKISDKVKDCADFAWMTMSYYYKGQKIYKGGKECEDVYTGNIQDKLSGLIPKPRKLDPAKYKNSEAKFRSATNRDPSTFFVRYSDHVAFYVRQKGDTPSEDIWVLVDASLGKRTATIRKFDARPPHWYGKIKEAWELEDSKIGYDILGYTGGKGEEFAAQPIESEPCNPDIPEDKQTVEGCNGIEPTDPDEKEIKGGSDSSTGEPNINQSKSGH